MRRASVKIAYPVPSEEQAIVDVAIDDGHQAIKLVAYEGDRQIAQLSFASRVRAGSVGVTKVGANPSGHVGATYSSEGEIYTVGDFVDAENVRFTGYPFSTINRVLVHHALRQAGLGGRRVRLATGLPISNYYLPNGQTNQLVLDRKREAMAKAIEAADGQPCAEIVSHEIYPEGLGAWVDWSIEEGKLGSGDAQMRAGAGEMTVAVIDSGGRTTDLAVVMAEQMIDHARSRSVDVGVIDLLRALSVLVQEKTGHEIAPVHLERALTTNTVRIYGDAVDIAEEVRTVKADIWGRIWREVERTFGVGVDIDRFLLVGGGAHLFADVAKKLRPNIEILNAPEFANVRGFGKFMRHSG